ncbi:MAG: succinyl-diaminopimelate desuccinylase [Solirubrobacteraceae bacterium]|nr:succinyl-diaminopimelate desuccinylase [Solirubrobacteraceae bacterium]
MKPEALAELLATLVDIPSVTGQEAAIADFVAGRLARRASGETLRSGHAVVWRAPARGRPLVVLAGHLDTVPPNGEARARLADGRLYGLGATDMKGGDAVMLGLVETLDPAALRFDLACVFYDAEEGPAVNNGLGRLIGEMPWLRDASLAVLLEPTDCAVEMGCSGMMNVEVTVRGKSAHSARPWTGVNAVERAAPWLAGIVRFPVTPHAVQGVEYRETLAVTLLKAGRVRNVVPDELVANLNYRFPPDRTLAESERKLRALVPADFEFAVVDQAEPGLVCSDRPIVRDFVDRFGLPVNAKQGWTDVARFTSAGIPAFNFGPGIPELCHVRDEYCPVANLGTAYDTLARFLQEPS